MGLLKVLGYFAAGVGLIAGGAFASAFVNSLTTIGGGLLVADGYRTQRKAKRRAIEQYNASLQDRLEMVDVSPDQARTLVLGRCRTVEGVRRRWVSGTNDYRLTMIISLAGHEIDAVEQVYFDDVPVTLDGSGVVTTEPFYKGRKENISDNFTLNGSGGGTFTLTQTPVGSVDAVWRTGSGDGEQQGALTVVSLVGTTLTVSGGPAGAGAWVAYSYETATYTARVRSYLGTASQNIGADLASEYPGKITSTDKFAGIACLVVDIYYDPDVYPQGRPTVTARIRGAKIYDPRLDSTAGGSGSHRIATPSTWTWSNNSALCAYHLARHVNSWDTPADEIMPAAEVAAEANWCDTATAFTLRKPDGTTEEVVYQRHTCDIVISTAGDNRGAMDEIIESMAGRSGWAGGVWRFRAGRMPAAVFDMDESWLARRIGDDGNPEPGPTLQFTNGVAREAKVNRITGSCVDADQRYQVLPFPAIEDATLIASEGATYPLEVEYQAVSHIAHAQHLASVAIRRNQAALKIQAQCNLWAYRLELFDVGTLTLPRYAIADKTMEVIGWRWHPTEGVQLRLAEITAAIYSVNAELSGRDPAPNTGLPSPWDVETLEGLAVTSGITALADGSIVSRARVAWTAAASQSVRAGGRTEIQFRQLTDAEWQSWPEDGASTSAIIPALRQGVYYVFRGRFQSASPLRVRGDWSAQVGHKMASTERDALNAAIAAADSAASAAQASADAANAALANIASDSLLSAVEKSAVVRDYAVILAEQGGIDGQAAAYGITTARTAYNASISALTSYLGGLTGWNVIPGIDVAIVGSTFRAAFADVYTARQALLDEIVAAAKLLANTAQSTADAAAVAASAAASAAATAQSGANTANAALADIASDGVLTPGEKPRVIQDRDVIVAEQAGIDAQAVNYSVTTERTAYDAAVSALVAYLATLTTPVLWSDLSGNTTIVGATFRANFADAYTKRQALLDAISAAAKARLGALATLGSVGTGQIDPEAATQVVVDETDLAGATYPSGLSVVRSFTVTPSVACIVEFTGWIEATNVDGDSGNPIGWGVTPTAGSRVSLGAQTQPSAGKFKHTTFATYTAAAGVELTFDISFSRAGAVMAAYGSYMRATLIKR